LNELEGNMADAGQEPEREILFARPARGGHDDRHQEVLAANREGRLRCGIGGRGEQAVVAVEVDRPALLDAGAGGGRQVARFEEEVVAIAGAIGPSRHGVVAADQSGFGIQPQHEIGNRHGRLRTWRGRIVGAKIGGRCCADVRRCLPRRIGRGGCGVGQIRCRRRRGDACQHCQERNPQGEAGPAAMRHEQPSNHGSPFDGHVR
jgi:hypothetical protein